VGRNEAKQVHGGTDFLHTQAGGNGHAGNGSLPESRCDGANDLSLEEQVRWVAAQRHQAIEAAGRGKCQAQEAGGGPEPRQDHAAGRSVKKVLRPAERREMADYLQASYQASERHSCRTLKIHRFTYRYQSKRCDQAFLRKRIKEIASVRIRYGYRRIHVLLKREGWEINHKRVYRLYRQEGLNLRYPSKRKKISQARAPSPGQPIRLNECWAMDFVSDQLYNGQRFRALTLIDTFSRECLAIHADKNIKGEMVANLLQDIQQVRGLPKRIKVDNGPEFISRALDAWAYLNNVNLDYSRPGKPTDNPHIESFNGSFREECLNTHWFMSLEDAKKKIEMWRIDYNEYRPHSGLTHLTPAEFATAAGAGGD